MNIIAIENDSVVNESIGPGYVFREGDILFVSGRREALDSLSEWA